MENTTTPATVPPILSPATLEALADAWEAVKEAMQRIVEAVAAIVRKIAERFLARLEKLLRCVNPRVCHLAFHAKKRRVRKKNMRRLLAALAQGPVP